MECQTGVEWNTQSRFVGVSCTTTSEVVDPNTTCCIVIHIIVFAISIVVDTIWDTRILHPIACSLYITWQTTSHCIGLIGKQLCTINHRFAALWQILRWWYVLKTIWLFIACYTTHTATKLNGVGCNHFFAIGCWCHHDIVVHRIIIKGESAEIYPCATTHLLVDREGGLLAFVYNGVLCFSGTLCHGLIADIHGIVACRKWWSIGHRTLYFIALCLLAKMAHSEWIISFQ